MKSLFFLTLILLITGCSQNKTTDIKENTTMEQSSESSTAINRERTLQKEIELSLATFFNEDNSVKEETTDQAIEAIEKQFKEAKLNDLNLYQKIEHVKKASTFYRNLYETSRPDNLDLLSQAFPKMDTYSEIATELDAFQLAPVNFYSKLLSWQNTQLNNAEQAYTQMKQIEPSLTIDHVFNISEESFKLLDQLMEKVSDPHLKDMLKSKKQTFDEAYAQVHKEALVAKEIRESAQQEAIEEEATPPNSQAIEEGFTFLRQNFDYDERSFPYITFSFNELSEEGIYLVEAMSSLARKSVATLVYIEESHTYMKAFDYY